MTDKFNSADNLEAEISQNLLRRLKECLAQSDVPDGLTNTVEAQANINSFLSYYRLLGQLAPELQQSGFFLRLGASYEIADLGLLGYAMISAADLQESWNLMIGDPPLLGHPCLATRQIIEDRIHVKLKPLNFAVGQIYLIEEWLAGTWSWICARLPQFADSPQMAVQLCYKATSYTELYEEIFPGQITFNAPFTSLSFPLEWYSLPLNGSNASVFHLTQQQCQRWLSEMEDQDSLVAICREHLLQSAHLGFLSLSDLSAAMGMAPYTLRRKLQKVGSSYKFILSDVRMHLAGQYLSRTALSIKEIGFLLGYEHTSSFCRAFKNCHDVSPDKLRK